MSGEWTAEVPSHWLTSLWLGQRSPPRNHGREPCDAAGGVAGMLAGGDPEQRCWVWVHRPDARGAAALAV